MAKKRHTPESLERMAAVEAAIGEQTMSVFELAAATGLSSLMVSAAIVNLVKLGRMHEVGEKVNPKNKKGVRAYSMTPPKPVVLTIAKQCWLSPLGGVAA